MNTSKIQFPVGLIALLLVLGCSFNADCQQYNLGTIVPPSPNAASLGKFGGINTNLSSGAVNFNIAIANYKTSKLSLPISVSYSSNGFKVDEIASRVGTGWNLNAGGVITRTVYGVMDEYSARPRLTELQYSSKSPRDQINYLNDITAQSQGLFRAEPDVGVDGQPDMFNFNFNGLTGQFIIKHLYGSGTSAHFECVLLNHSGLKMETGLGSLVATGYAFKATTIDGVQYIFNATESTVQNDGLINDIPMACPQLGSAVVVPSAFYLSQIIHPNKDTINLIYIPRAFHYATGITQSIYHIDPAHPAETCGDPASGFTYPGFTDNLCANTLKTNGWILSEINSRSGGKIKFNYINRSDYDDQLLSSIVIYQPNQTVPIKKDTLIYQYANNRPFLMSITEKDAGNTSNQKHEFNYYNLSQVPAHLSYSQDHWGFFNGKANNTMIPRPTDPDLQYYFPQATANRDPDPDFCKTGVLSSVKYPTGGKDSIIYEGNSSYGEFTTYPALFSSNIYVTGNGLAWPNSTYSSNAVIATRQRVTLEANCEDNTINPDDPVVYFKLTKVGTGSIYEKQLNYGESVSTTLILEPGTYTLETTIYGNATVNGLLYYFEGSPTTQEMNVPVGGIRVAKAITYDPVSNTSIVKKYGYTLFDDNTKVSADVRLHEQYFESLLSHALCAEYNSPCGQWLSKGYLCMHSNSIYNIYSSSSSPVTYKNVTEIFGENAERGVVKHEFTSIPDADANVQNGRYVSGTPVTSFNLINGKETFTGIFKNTTAGLTPVKKIFIHYKDDARKDSTIAGFSAMREYDYNCSAFMTTSPFAEELAAYDLTTYQIYRKWLYTDTVRTQTFDVTGTSYAENIETSEYGNAYHALLTKNTELDSKGNILISTYTYPTDYSATIYANMAGLHMLSPVVEKSVFKNTNLEYSTLTNYLNPSGNLYLPSTVQSKFGSGSYDTRLHYSNYDSFGNATCVSKESGPKVVYLYSYGGQYPIAEIKNADYAAVETALGATNIANFSNQFPDKSAVDSFLSTLVTSIPSAQVSKFVFTPLVGMTSMTDAKGQTMYYEYDSFQRLVNIKDQYGNIVKHNDYHYYNQ
ncbi:hypothetical protein [Mucilaginibacter boryungensis]|uniref:YD repeat-containing protein n=1 Tax=Mucilaginibacter boryungensis TaxID=768480 RepID=A0ABR9XM24_9SPHI|nr:hypothetical protein [Mucilaginibacter boryungensis]MBE9668257.1 hypothetical protein [Mucilaginibacter boryungensis]